MKMHSKQLSRQDGISSDMLQGFVLNYVGGLRAGMPVKILGKAASLTNKEEA